MVNFKLGTLCVRRKCCSLCSSSFCMRDLGFARETDERRCVGEAELEYSEKDCFADVKLIVRVFSCATGYAVCIGRR